jgi:hypothetical protein
MGKRTDHTIRWLRQELAKTRYPDFVLAIAAGIIAAMIVALLKVVTG